MSDDQTTTGSESQQTSDSNTPPEWVGDPTRAWDAIQELRRENQSRRQNETSLTQGFETLSQQLSQLLPSEEDAEPQDFDSPVDALESRLNSLQQAFEQQQQQLQQAQVNAQREAVAREFNLPDVLAARVQGNSLEEMRADAEQLATLVTSSSNQQPEPQAQETPTNARDFAAQRYRNRTTTGLPSGQASANKDAERRKRYFNK